jgi:hypothetical protein
MSFKRFVLAAVLGVAAIGCGGVKETKVTVQTSAIEANVRKTLEDYEKTGKVGSNLTSLESDINGIKASDSAKGAALMEGYKQLQLADSPDKVKAAAKDMLSKL